MITSLSFLIVLLGLVCLVIVAVLDAVENMLKIVRLVLQAQLICFIKFAGLFVPKDFILILQQPNARSVQFN